MIPVTRFASLSAVPHAVSSRRGGVSTGPFHSLNLGYSTADAEVNVTVNRAALYERLGVDPDRTIGGWLSHGNAVSEFHAGRPEEWPVLRRPIRPASQRSEPVFRSDAVVSDVPGLHFMLTFADCVPILFADTRRNVVGAAHAGWRGTAAGIAAAVVRTMCCSFGCAPGDMVVAIGPSIGPCCYTVGPEVPAAFAAHDHSAIVAAREGQIFLDLWESNLRQLVDAGIDDDAIECAGVCTSCRADLYFSHRAGRGNTGRFAACIGAA